MTRTRFILSALLVLACAGGAGAQCLDGDYVVVGEPLFSSPGGAFADVITITGETVAMGGACPAVRGQFRTTSRGTVVRAVWLTCGSFASRVRLRAVVNKPCRTMRGRVVTRRPRATRRFVAQHDVACESADASCGACTRNADCTTLEYCAKAPGACSANGSCEPRPVACTRELRPVCGCDGITYSNPCDAAAHGTSVVHEGRCTNACGTIAGSPCPAGEFCDLAPGMCGGADLGGRCLSVPEACALHHAPVCGCDGVTYGNDCARRGAKAQKAHDGRCAPAGVCGGIAGFPCEPTEFCELPKGECHTADLQGICLPVPKLCPDLRAPVCGCDGVTYGNECERRVAGVQHGHQGPCSEK